MGIVDLAKRAIKTVFPDRAQAVQPPPAPPQRAAESETTTLIRGIDVSKSLFVTPVGNPNLPKVVLAFLDGRRVRGNIFNFSPSRDVCHFIRSTATGGQSEKINLKELKAIFYLRESNSAPPSELSTAMLSQSGRRIEVIFSDNERLRGSTTGFDRERLGFFMVPHDPKGKCVRVFVVKANTKEVNWL